MRAEHTHGFARLNQQRLIVFEPLQRRDNAIEAFPVARSSADAAIHDQLRRPLRDLGVEIVHEHAQRRLGEPALGREGGAARGTNNAGCIDSGHGDS